MAIIPQLNLFSWEEIDDLGDLARLKLVLETLPDEGLMRLLEKERGRGRDDYPVRATWNSIIAGIVYQHPSIESLRRELLRNRQLLDLCGFDPLLGVAAVPSPSAYSCFLENLMKHGDKVEEVFDSLVDSLEKELSDFGVSMGVDGKAISSHANPRKAVDGEDVKPDGRRDLDANTGVKTYKGKRKDGALWKKVVSWFGYKLHLVVDTNYELPVAFEVTRASAAEQPVARELIKKLHNRRPEILERCEAFSADKGYDDKKLIKLLWDDHDIKPVIDIRDMWKDGEETKLVEGTQNVLYDYKGTVTCHCFETGEERHMAFGGFEKDRNTLKYRCPAMHYGYECSSANSCPSSKGVRIPLSEDRRVFTPIARSSAKWRREYNKRTSVERVNSRLDVSFEFERHFIRGLKKMKLRCGLALIVMLAMALGRVREKRMKYIRSLVALPKVA